MGYGFSLKLFVRPRRPASLDYLGHAGAATAPEQLSQKQGQRVARQHLGTIATETTNVSEVRLPGPGRVQLRLWVDHLRI